MFKIFNRICFLRFLSCSKIKCLILQASVLFKNSEFAEDVAFDLRSTHTMRQAFSLGNFNGHLEITAKLRRKRGQVAKGAVIVINNASVQNLLAPFCCVFEKDTLQQYPLLGPLRMQL